MIVLLAIGLLFTLGAIATGSHVMALCALAAAGLALVAGSKGL